MQANPNQRACLGSRIWPLRGDLIHRKRSPFPVRGEGLANPNQRAKKDHPIGMALFGSLGKLT